MRESRAAGGNGAEVLVRALPWGDVPAVETLRAELGREVTHILCSDLVYFPVLYPPLVATLLALTDTETEVEVIIAYKTRNLYKESPFWDMLGEEFVMEPVCVRRVGGGEGDGVEGGVGGKDGEEEAKWERFGKEEGVGVMVCRRKKRGERDGVGKREVGFEDLVLLGMGEGVFD